MTAFRHDPGVLDAALGQVRGPGFEGVSVRDGERKMVEGLTG